jgi:hypothetical protein
MSNTNEPAPFSQLPKLLKTLSDEVSSFLDLKLKLLRREFWQEAQGFLSRSVGIAAAAVVTFAGFMVLIASLVLALNIWLQNLLLSCLIVGGICFAGGAATAVLLARRLSNVELTKTRAELDKDKQWIKAQTTQL